MGFVTLQCINVDIFLKNKLCGDKLGLHTGFMGVLAIAGLLAKAFVVRTFSYRFSIASITAWVPLI